MYSKKLAVCAIFENEARLLPEWLAYHHLVGVEHFVLYDNGSTDQSAQAIHESPVALQATLIRWPQKPGRMAAYRHFIDIFAPGFDWVAFIDVGQFLLPLGSRSVTDTLDWLNTAAAILVPRRVFAPGDWPAGTLAIEAFCRRAPDAFPANRHVRTIARCAELLDVAQQPHEFRLNGPAFNTAGHLVPNQAILDQPSFQNLVIHQYCTQADPGALARMLDPATDAPLPAEAALRAALSEQGDDGMQAFAPAVRHLLGLQASAPAAVAASPAPGEPTAQATPQDMPDAVVGMPAATWAAPAMPSSPFISSEPLLPARPGIPFESDASQPAAAPAPVIPAVVSAPLSEVQPVILRAPLIQADPGIPSEPLIPAAPLGAPRIEPAPEGWMPPPAAPPHQAAVETAAPAAQALVAPGWTAALPEGQVRTGGLALVFRDRSRPGEIWLAALRGAAADGIDPAFLTDEFERIRDFPTDAAARAACDAVLAQGPRP